MENSPNIASIALGTNLGDKLVNLKTAITEIKKIPSTFLLKQSSIFETEPLTKNGENPQDIPSYYNAALLVSTTLSPKDLFHALCDIEKQMGRTEKHNWQPRLIDLDLLFYSDLVLNTPELTLPHPELHTRAFVLEPLLEISPEWTHPLIKKTVAQMAKSVEGKLRKLESC